MIKFFLTANCFEKIFDMRKQADNVFYCFRSNGQSMRVLKGHALQNVLLGCIFGCLQYMESSNETDEDRRRGGTGPVP